MADEITSSSSPGYIVLDAMRFHGSGAILDWLPGTFCLDLMCSVLLTGIWYGIYFLTLVYHR